ncbi:MAG: methyltransferase domain-containing protein [Bacteroidetes bacterium]|nr:methyltransferase domain-containing protein [Bacteroidota bacterium]
MFKKLKRFFLRDTASDKAYNQWSEEYDNQPDNLMLALDEEIIGKMLEEIPLQGKTIVDIGCGTGRHWQKLFASKPALLLGYDVSEGMLEMLNKKFPQAKTYHIKGEHLPGLEDHSCDFIISTLTVAHINNLENTLNEWDRVLKPGAGILISDFHPDLLAKGGKRTFKKDGELISIKNYIHSIDKIKKIAGQLGWQAVRFIERNVDEQVKHFYEKQNALPVYKKFFGEPVIYAIYLIKADVAATG